MTKGGSVEAGRTRSIFPDVIASGTGLVEVCLPSMDVRCDRCQTEYQFEESRIPEQGISMRCTSCGHVLKVQKGGQAGFGATSGAASIPLPAPPMRSDPASRTESAAGSAEVIPLPLPAAPPKASVTGVPSPPGGKPVGEGGGKEWKIRQVGGSLFTFRELTTLQKWIVERKVSRDDEISLNGESWRKLGAIGELTIFFQVVDEAQRAAQLTPAPRRTPEPRPAVSPLPPPALAASSSAAPVPLPAASPAVPAPVSNPVAAPPARPEPRPEPLVGIGQMPLRPPGPPEPSFSHFSPVLKGPGPGADFDDFDSLRQSSRAGRNLALGMLGLVGVLGAFYLYRRYEDESVTRARYTAVEQAKPPAPARPSAPPSVPPVAPPSVPPVVEEAPGESAVARLPPQAKEPGPSPEMATPSAPVASETRETGEAGATAPIPLAAPSPAAAAPPAPIEERRDFDWLVRRADKLREQEKPEQALELYGKAADLRPNRAEAIAGKGLALFDMGQKLPAEAAFKRALELNPKSGTALIGLAETYRSMSRTEEAIAYYEKYLDTLPDGPEAGVARSSIRRLRDR